MSRIFTILSFLGLLLLGPGKAALAKDALQKVRLQLQYLHQFQFAGFYVAEARGLYRKAGLEVEIKELTPGQSVTDKVLAGEAEFGVSDTELLQERLRGKPLVALGVVFQNSAYCMVTLGSSQILSLADLRGKRVGVPTGRGGSLFRASFQAAGIPLSSMEVSEPGWGMGPLLSGELDAKVGYSTDSSWELREAGKLFHIIYPLDYGIDFYGDTLFTREALIESNPELVERFRQASFEGWKLAFEDVDATIDLILPFASVQERKITRDRLRHEASVMRHLILPNLVEWGSMKEERWHRMADTLMSLDSSLKPDNFKGFVYQTAEQRKKVLERGIQLVAGFLLLMLVLSALWIYQLRRAVGQKTQALSESERLARLSSEEAKAANEAKSMFLAGVSHEFRTPLTAICGFADLLSGTALNEQQQSWLQVLRARAQDLLQLVNQLLQLIEADVQSHKPHSDALVLRDELPSLLKTFLDSDTQQRFTLSIAEEVPEQVSLPPLVLRQILLNLIQNAKKYGPSDGTIALKCSLECSADQKKNLILEVRDEGPGIPEELSTRLFEPFSRGKSVGGASSGLGLSICRKLLTASGGEIWYRNHQPHGCSFFVRIPLPDLAKPENLSLTQGRILLVDDDPVNRDLVRTLFHMHGLELEEAFDGKEALAKANQKNYAFILMDLGLPDMGGIEVLHQLRKSGLNQQTPVIALTASVTEHVRRQCEEAGMLAFLEKPIDFPRLLKLLGR